MGGTVEFTGIDTFFGKTAALLADTEELSNVQLLLISIVRNLTILSLVMCAVVLVYVMTIVPFMEALSFVVVLMVASIPMAMEIVTTTTLALGSKELTKHGAIVTRLAAIEDMAGMAILCSDKKGTLTLNEMHIQEHTPVYSPGETQYSLLRLAAMAAKWHEPARDALDKLVLGCDTNPNGVDLKSMECIEQLDYLPFDPVIKRTEGTVKDKSGKINGGQKFKTSKGAPQVLLKLVSEAGGCDAALKKQIEKDVTDLGKRGIRAIAVAKTDEGGVWRMMGLLTFLDPPRPDTKDTVRLSKENGVAVKMITGDHLLIAMETARVLDMGDCIQSAEGLPLLDKETKAKPANLGRDYGDKFLAADGFAQTYPEHKYLITIGYDLAVAPKTPPTWNLPFLFSMAFVQAFVAMISSINLLYILLHSWDEGSMMRQLGLGGISYGKITASIYLKVSVSDFLTLFSARAGGDWFFMVKPAPILAVGGAFAVTCSTCFAMFWPKSYPDGIQTEGLVQSPPYMLEVFVWSWSLSWWLAEDAAKVFCRWIVHKNNIFDINNTGVMVMTEGAKKEMAEMRANKDKAYGGHH